MLKFLVFSDTHYSKGQYRTQVSDIEGIMARAHEERVDFVVHAGDFSNDYKGSIEFLNAYLHNPWDIPVYGVYGNHELQFDNTMAYVSAHLCNRDVCFAPPVYNESVSGHWYADIKDYRLIGLDTNFSYNKAQGCWERNTALACRAGNHVKDSLSPAQLDWLYDRLSEAHAQKRGVIVVSHAGLCDLSFEWSPDAEHAQHIFSRFPGTVLMAINGHYHTDHLSVRGGVCYFDVNTAINGCWVPSEIAHYAPGDTFLNTEYDSAGRALSTQSVPFSQLSGALHTWSFKEPLSAVVTIDGTHIDIRGSKTEWDCGVVPTPETATPFYDGIKPEIPDRVVELPR